MTNEERRKAAEWFRNRAKNCPMQGARRMYEIATEALEERERNELPPHGRLIDADTLKLDLTRFYDGEVTAKRLIDEQPTIIPAEEGE